MTQTTAPAIDLDEDLLITASFAAIDLEKVGGVRVTGIELDPQHGTFSLVCRPRH